MPKSISAIEQAEEVVFDYVRRKERESFLRLGLMAQKISANAGKVDD